MSSELQVGDAFAGHRIDAVAGRGGMGVVYRATQLDLDRTVALKLITPSLAQDPMFRERFIRETRVAAGIDHPNVIPVFYAGENEGRLYLAMRYVMGEDLRTLVRREGALQGVRAARIVAQVASALDAAHASGIVHRDVKPANILLGTGEHAYLTDFGLTKRVHSASGMTQAGGWVGTLGFVSPEQIRGEHVDARTDVYALGCVLHHALTGAPPHQRETDEATLWAHLHEPPPPLGLDVPAPLSDVVVRALAKDPDDRFPSAGDLGRALLAAVGLSHSVVPERMVATGAAAPA
ncbi:MAG: serine/threonine protein kinase, partial [Solirubrobacterales bacterium]|nr:serine/threonine protein kinase [Solirubrobacterales bacterium]